MKIYIIHPSLNRLGGAELLCLKLIEALIEKGYHVILISLDKVNWEKVKISFKNYIRPSSEYFLFEKLPNYKPEFINWVILGVSYLRLMLTAQKDTESICINNYGEIFPFINDICYINALPLFILHKNLEYNPFQIPFWRITSRIYYLVYRILRKLFKMSNIITNSQYNALNIKKNINNKVLVIYPPVRITEKNSQNLIKKKEKLILTISRISLKKNLSMIIKIANNLRQEKYKFVIAGSVINENDYFQLTERINRLGLSNIEIIKDPSYSNLNKLMSHASIYLSPLPTEAFGIAIVEAMSLGCIPVVPKTGGPWIDILSEKNGKFGYGFKTPEQASRYIKKIFNNPCLNQKLPKNAIGRSKKFHENIFKKLIVSLISNIDVSHKK